MASIFSRARAFIKHYWNAFQDAEQKIESHSGQTSFSSVPYRPRLQYGNEKSIIAAIYTRLSMDVASISMRHIRMDDEGRYLEDIMSGLNWCLNWEANLDQGARQFRQDVALRLFDHGAIAIVPVETAQDPTTVGSIDIRTLRVGPIVGWSVDKVLIRLYNDLKGNVQDIWLPKKIVAVVENPLYSVMNERNSILQRLVRKLNLLDAVDEQSASGKLDIIIQLPYVVRSESKKAEANRRRTEMEDQLRGSQYGVAYIDGAEKITQLNRPSENNLLKQVEYLTNMLYTQLGLTPSVMDGTADESAMLNYTNRTIEPIVSAIVEAMRRAFLTRTARSQGQDIRYFNEPFKLVPMEKLADIADKLSRNEIVTPNEMRGFIGLKPSTDPQADVLKNRNMPDPNPAPAGDPMQAPLTPEGEPF